MPPIPPIPPMPPPMPAGIGGSSFGISVMTASAVVSRDATPDASTIAVLTTYKEKIVTLVETDTYLGRIDDAPLVHIDILSVERVVPVIAILLLDLGNDRSAIYASIARNRHTRHLQRPLDDLDADVLVIVGGLDGVQALGAAQQSGAAARHDALFDCCAGGVQSVGDAVFLLVHFHFAAAAYFQDGHAGCQASQTFLEGKICVSKSPGNEKESFKINPATSHLSSPRGARHRPRSSWRRGAAAAGPFASVNASVLAGEPICSYQSTTRRDRDLRAFDAITGTGVCGGRGADADKPWLTIRKQQKTTSCVSG
ncbi:unnamed protein product [Acanthoscelides obtectus]|uniref:Uncharacterized protein n=1 Tax=Acanthoscelides obtectus TaxID=200917 RepID=A0A9P0KRN3_ACAOB|nr:unnamed protein product [Acanthoscelides obtectus]CAK1660646.1 hypothetical protein AOBTE_LOCUS22200 [Acanthoscelides obtectus]